jgi:hypothetical protein
MIHDTDVCVCVCGVCLCECICHAIKSIINMQMCIVDCSELKLYAFQDSVAWLSSRRIDYQEREE